jgi:NADH-quinone oxidoreductase subunit J
VLVYVGAVVVLILFGLMLTRAPIGPMAQHNEQGVLALGVSLALFGFLCVVIFQAFGDVRLTLVPVTAAAIGEVLYVQWAFPFMSLGFLLTVALIGAIVMARREEGEGPEPPTEVDADADSRLRPHRPDPTTAEPGVFAEREQQVRS